VGRLARDFSQAGIADSACCVRLQLVQVNERELEALEAIVGSAVLERFGIEAELGDVLRQLNSRAGGANDAHSRRLVFGT